MNRASSARSRLVAVDAARGLAVITMFIAHVAPIEDDSPLIVRVLVVADAITAPLFALLVGVSLALMTRTTLDRGLHAKTVVQLLIRAAIIAVIGLLLELAGAQVAIVLMYLGVTMALLIPFSRVKPVITLCAGIALLAVSPLAVELTRTLVVQDRIAILQPNVPVIGDAVTLLAGGPYYQVIAFLGYGLLGLTAARLDLTRARTSLTLLFAGTAAIVLGYAFAKPLGITAAAYAPTILSYAVEAGWACAILGALCWITTCAPARAAQISRTVLVPLADVGTMTLTIYSAQIIVLGIWARTHPGQVDDSWLMLAILVVGAFAFAVPWRRFVGRGPLEWLIALASGRVVAPGPRGAESGT